MKLGSLFHQHHNYGWLLTTLSVLSPLVLRLFDSLHFKSEYFTAQDRLTYVSIQLRDE